MNFSSSRSRSPPPPNSLLPPSSFDSNPSASIILQKIQIEVNDQPVKGMKMRLGRAGEGYFVAETSSPPPPEFRASIDPEHGLSDDESYDLEPRATHDDWAEQDEQQARVVDMLVEPPADGNWGDIPPIPSTEDRSHLRLRSTGNSSNAAAGQASENAGENRQRLRSSASAQSVLSNPSAALTSSGELKETKGLKISNGAREADFDRRSDDGRINASLVSELDPSQNDPSSYEQLTSSDPIILAPTANRNADHAIAISSKKNATSTTAAKPAGKSWGLSLFGFLGKKEQQPQGQQALEIEDDEDDESLLRPTGANATATGRRTSLDLPENARSALGLDASATAANPTSFAAAASNDPNASKHIQSSSLPSHWGPSPLHTYAPTTTVEVEEPVVEEKSRQAEDGSGVIYLGQKKKPRSSSITSSSSMSKVGGSSDATPSKSKSGAQSPNIPSTSVSPVPMSSVSPTTQSVNANGGHLSITDTLTAAGNRSKPANGVAPSSPDSDEEYQDMVFEMDEEAYAAANPFTTSGSSTTSPIFTSPGHASSAATTGASTTSSSSGPSPSPSPTVGSGSQASYMNQQQPHGPSTNLQSSAGGLGVAGLMGSGGGDLTLQQHHSHAVESSSASTGSSSRSQKPLLEASRCGMQAVACADSDPQAALEAFNSARLTYAAMNEDPTLIFGPDIVFRMKGAYYPIHTAGPMFFSVALFNEPLGAPAIERLLHQQTSRAKLPLTASQQQQHQHHQQQQQKDLSSSSAGSLGKAWGRIWQWGKDRADEAKASSAQPSHTSQKSSDRNSNTGSPPIGRASGPTVEQHHRASRSGDVDSNGASYSNAGALSPKPHRARSGSKGPSVRVGGLTKDGPAVPEGDFSVGPQSLFHSAKDASSGIPGAAASEHSGEKSSASSSAGGAHGASSSGSEPHGGPYYVRTLKPTSDKLKALGLKPGANKIVFRVNSRLQGSQQLSSTVYLWDREAKIVISDIDGTITKSDVLGQIFPVFGKDWSHMGVAQLFQNVKANGYEILYLTARAIGAAALTKGFLTSLQQGSVRLPDGPVFMSPDRLLYSLNREVILRKPEEFKIQCLGEIKSLFLSTPNEKSPGPFYAGFGNRETDALSYVAVGIPAGKTFTINPSGEITGHSKSIQRTYTRINELVEQMFPAYHKKKSSSATKPAEQWNDFQFWDTRPAYSLEELEKELLK